jgi:hypothetical protein
VICLAVGMGALLQRVTSPELILNSEVNIYGIHRLKLRQKKRTTLYKRSNVENRQFFEVRAGPGGGSQI